MEDPEGQNGHTEEGNPPQSEQNGYQVEAEEEEAHQSGQPEKSSPRKKKIKRAPKREKRAESTDDENNKEEGGNKRKRKKKQQSKKIFERRNIKAVFSEDRLEESTKNALAEEQQRLQRLQQAQRDAFANEVLRDFDLKQLTTGAKAEEIDEEIIDETVKSEQEVKPKVENFIDLSSDEEVKPSKYVIQPESVQKSGGDKSDSSDIQILSEVEGVDEDDPDNSGMHTNDRLNVRTPEGKVIINTHEKNPDQFVYVADSVEGFIKPHQIGGVRFLYDNIIISPSDYEEKPGFGCILAHAMGLGKTLQIVTFSDVFLRATSGRHVLIIVPINTLQNWVSEFKHWLPHEPFKVHLLGDNLKTIAQRANIIKNWNEEGGVLLMGYELFRLLAGTKAQQRKKKASAKKKPVCIDIEEEDKEKDILIDVRKILVDPGPDLVICDEGHRIKNAHASISQVLKSIRTRRRVVLTGYPLQNNLMEYWCMVDFVRPNYLGTRTEFSNMFERPIQNGQCVDSTPRDVRLMMHRAHVLHNQLKGFVQRRSHRVLRQNLPPKYEHVLMVKMTVCQRKLYATFIKDLLAQKSVANPLKAFAVCCKIWNHPDVLCNFLRQKEASEELDLDLEDIASSKKGKKKAQPKRNTVKPNKVETKVENTQKEFEGGSVMNGNNGYNGNPAMDVHQQQYLQQQQQFFQQPQQPFPQQQQQFFQQQQQQQQPYHQQNYPQQQMYDQQNYYGQQGGEYQQYPYQEYPHGSQHQPQQQPPLQMLQGMIPGNEQHHGFVTNGSVPVPANAPQLVHDGPGFDPFVKDDPVKKDEISYDWANGMFNDYSTGLLENSNKFIVLFKLLEETIRVGERILLFSQSLLTLDLIETFLQEYTIPTTEDKWANGVNYFRLDGSTPSMERDRLINAFNKAEAIKVPLFLVSTRAGSLGINLVGANRVVIFDASWNPCHDSQAVCRVYRYGQTKPCYIYRLVSDQCLEKKIYDRQVNKQGMSDRVVDEANPDNYLSTKDIHTLWDEDDLLDEIPDKEWNVQGCIDKCNKLGDVVLANVIQSLGLQSLSRYPFTHESLLIDRKEKKLSSIEKRIAVKSYEAEKNSQISYTRPSYSAYYPRGPGPPGFNPKGPENQNYIGCRKESWKPPPMGPEGGDQDTNGAYIPPRSHPNYNGMGQSSGYPATSQPLQAFPPGSPSGSGGRGVGGGNRFPIEALARRDGVKLQEVTVPKNIVIPTKNQTPIALKAGQRVMLIKTPKGIYLRLRDQIVKIRVPNGLIPFASSMDGDFNNSNGPGKRPVAAAASSAAKPDVVTLLSSGEDE